MNLNQIKLKEGAVLTSLSDGRKVYKDVLNATYNLGGGISLTLLDIIRLLNTSIENAEKANFIQAEDINALNTQLDDLNSKLNNVISTIQSIASAVDKLQAKLDDDLL